MSDLAVPELVGFTVGVGSPYAEIASLSASCFSHQMGMPAIVLGEQEFAASGLPHPAALRLVAFDYIAAKRVVYFDADWFCLRPWSPFSGNSREIRACRDFILRNEFPHQRYDFESPEFLNEPQDILAPDADLRQELLREVEQFASIHLPYSQWINSGLLILDREHHSAWFGKALELYLGAVGHHPLYFEQPALVKALECLNLRVRLLPRRLNVLAAYETKWPPSVTGLHVKLKRHGAFLSNVQSGLIRTPDDVTAYFTSIPH